MSRTPELSLEATDGRAIRVGIDGEKRLFRDFLLTELERVRFVLEPAETNTEYQIRIGDFLGNSRGGESEKPAAIMQFGARLQWEDGCYFESARGDTTVSLLGRAAGAADWTKRAEFVICVCPEKISNDQYEAMCEDLLVFGAGILHDLISKSRSRLSDARSSWGHEVEISSLEELRDLERTMARISAQLRQILAFPLTSVKRDHKVSSVRGDERLDAVGCRNLSAVIKFARSGMWPVEVKRQVARETVDTIEHGAIAYFLDHLLHEVQGCLDDALSTAAAYEEDLRFLKHLGANTEIRSTQKLEALRAAVLSLRQLEGELTDRRFKTWLREIRSRFCSRITPVFSSVPPYRAIWSEMGRWLGAAGARPSLQIEEKSKSTWRLYEQWVFLSLISAFRAAGLPCSEQMGALRKKTRYRFNLDLDRGSQVSFQVPGGRLIVRYEPWVTSRDTALARGETVYRGAYDHLPLSPDVLVELRRSSSSGSEETTFAFVIDAKYSRSVRPQHEAVYEKYLTIRCVRTNRQVVKQVWIALPAGQGIEIHDAVSWTDRGPDLPLDERLKGRISALPVPHTDSSKMEPPAELFEFATGMLRYMNIGPVDSDQAL